jgi:uncharacterized protein YbbC (DUF1343 family)
MLDGLDLFVVDLQDVGTRVYTFAWTVKECLLACAERGLPVLVLDRPNPLGGVATEGAPLDERFQSFVGGASIPMRHGLTLGELATLLNDTQAIGAEVSVVEMRGWRRAMLFAETGLKWVPPSPNLPTRKSTLVYPGQVLLEGTNLSEGRGTTTPFELVGAPFLNPFDLADALNSRDLPGVRFRSVRFRPTFEKWSDTVCGGVCLHVTDPHAFRPYRTTLEILSAIWQCAPEEVAWNDPPYEYETERIPIDLISGDNRLRTWLDGQRSLSDEQIEQLCDTSDWSARAKASHRYK